MASSKYEEKREVNHGTMNQQLIAMALCNAYLVLNQWRRREISGLQHKPAYINAICQTICTPALCFIQRVYFFLA